MDSWKHCQKNKGLEIYGWCIMTSHVHMIIGSRNMLEDIAGGNEEKKLKLIKQKITPAITRVTQDKHPSNYRRIPSFA